MGGDKHSFELAFSDYSQYNSTRDVGVNFLINTAIPSVKYNVWYGSREGDYLKTTNTGIIVKVAGDYWKIDKTNLTLEKVTYAANTTVTGDGICIIKWI